MILEAKKNIISFKDFLKTTFVLFYSGDAILSISYPT